MYSSTFIFAKKDYDDRFHALDQRIADMAKAIPGYLGENAWENPTTGLISTVYYWDSLEALQQLMNDPTHREAKQEQGKWLAGYEIVIAKILHSHGDDGLGELATLPPALRGYRAGNAA